MDIKYPDRLEKNFLPVSELGFGKHFTDHMFVMRHNYERGWHDAEIKPYGAFELDPASNCLHYGQAVFEGLKAFKWKDGSINLFRPEENAKRLNHSAKVLCMEPVPERMQLEGIKSLITVDQKFIPTEEGASLYIRPTLIGTTPELGVKPSREYLFYVILSPSGPYFKKGFNPLSIFVTDEYSRAAPGGVGNAKAAGNYAASLRAQKLAAEMGCSQVLYLDAVENKFLEEVGAMNVFVIKNGELITPPLTGTILPGITRKSILKLAPRLGVPAKEKRITIDEVIEGIESGEITEMGGTGTAASVASVGEIIFNGKKYEISKEPGRITQALYIGLTGIQKGERADTFRWMKSLNSL